jgi:hypothetical protein
MLACMVLLIIIMSEKGLKVIVQALTYFECVIFGNPKKTFSFFKGIVQRKLRWVEIGIKRKVLL